MEEQCPIGGIIGRNSALLLVLIGKKAATLLVSMGEMVPHCHCKLAEIVSRIGGRNNTPRAG